MFSRIRDSGALGPVVGHKDVILDTEMWRQEFIVLVCESTIAQREVSDIEMITVVSVRFGRTVGAETGSSVFVIILMGKKV